MTDPSADIIYVRAVSRETAKIALTLAAANEFTVKVAEIHNDYITAPIKEKIWTFTGREFSEHDGRKSILVCALYGLKISGDAFQNHLTECMHHMVFSPYPDDLDIWTKPMVRPNYGFNYYAYVLIYVDDVMVIHHDAESVISKIDKYFKFKPSSIGDPNIYLGDKLNKMILENGVWAWANIPSKLCQGVGDKH